MLCHILNISIVRLNFSHKGFSCGSDGKDFPGNAGNLITKFDHPFGKSLLHESS